MQKNSFGKQFSARVLFTILTLTAVISIFTQGLPDNKIDNDNLQKRKEKKEQVKVRKSWQKWFNEPIYVDVPVLKELHADICIAFEIDDLYKEIALLPDRTYGKVTRAVSQDLTVQKKIKMMSDPLAIQLVCPLLDVLRKGYWVRMMAKEAIKVSWRATSWAKLLTLYGCDFVYTVIAYPRHNLVWRFVKSLVLSDWYTKLYKTIIPSCVQKKECLNFIVNAYALAGSSYLLNMLGSMKINSNP